MALASNLEGKNLDGFISSSTSPWNIASGTLPAFGSELFDPFPISMGP